MEICETASPESADPDLLTALRAGDPRLWDATVARYGNLVRYTARRYRLSPEQCADVVQTTWMRFVQNLHRIREPQAIGSWLATTAAREAMAVSRQDRREIPTEVFADTVAVTVDVVSQLDAAWWAGRLRAAVATLPPRERAVVHLLLQPEPLSYQQISRQLGMPLGSVGPVRQRALRRLQDALGPLLGEVPEARPALAMTS
jgi:RNA polymerase sigma factor (sigma-70 family)